MTTARAKAAARSAAATPSSPAGPPLPSAQPDTTPEPQRACWYCKRSRSLSQLVPFVNGAVCADSTDCELYVRAQSAGPMPPPVERTCARCSTRRLLRDLEPIGTALACTDQARCLARQRELHLLPETEDAELALAFRDAAQGAVRAPKPTAPEELAPSDPDHAAAAQAEKTRKALVLS